MTKKKAQHSPSKDPTTFLFMGSSALKNNHIWTHMYQTLNLCVKENKAFGSRFNFMIKKRLKYSFV